MLQITVKPLAKVDLENIWLYTLDKWGIDQADFYQDELYNGLQLLSEKISIAKIEMYDNNEVYLKYKVNHHYLFCKVEADKLVLIRVLHEKMDFIRHL